MIHSNFSLAGAMRFVMVVRVVMGPSLLSSVWPDMRSWQPSQLLDMEQSSWSGDTGGYCTLHCITVQALQDVFICFDNYHRTIVIWEII